MTNTPSHLAIFLRSLAGGGAEKVIVNLSGSFVERGLKVDLLLTNINRAYIVTAVISFMSISKKWDLGTF